MTAIVLELYRAERDAFAAQLQQKIAQAPALFHDSPVVISLERLEQTVDAGALGALLDICREAGLKPMALRVGDAQAPLVADTGLPRLPLGSGRAALNELAVEPAKAVAPEVVVQTVVEEKLVQRPSKLVTRPVRSGQQVYAEGADLVILAPVSEGAEVLADGSIHVYGPLRGRALAGVKGDTQARIFCQSLEAELVSIAGNFKLSEALHGERWKQAAHISLQDELLNVMPL